ncbi:hypothetical protein SKAU_G00064260 [Synaphobranchus kaupii]|uniref:Uncharacterized protein n=1 Tax=Synaphobranchus kaupii TaxID=118154 RepID=A0A9Q1G6E9_SYNKA|nr:hypothetical protein SKAU_G00064260 [Synaphobranchus kaupii]
MGDNNESKVGPVGIGVAVGLCVIVLIIIICLLKRACKKCKCCKCCKRKKPTLSEKLLTKMGLKKSRRPFSVSGILDKK